jgi:hypothetical protein
MTDWMRIKLPAALLILSLASFVVFLEVEASNDSDEQTGPSAVWTPAENDLTRVRQVCNAASGLDFSSCFIAQMSALGAAPEAIAFTRTYAEQNHGVVAFLHGFRPVDLVDLGYALFPAGADFSQRWLLLNGSPAIIDVDGLSRLPQADLEKDPAFVALRQRYPKVTLFDGDRSFDSLPEMQTGSDGAQEFAIDYPLKDQCRACPVLGTARFSFEFDPAGRLAAVKFLKVTTAGE